MKIQILLLDRQVKASRSHSAQSEVPITPARIDNVVLTGLEGGWIRWIGPAVSVGILAAALWQLREVDVPGLIALLPSTVSFWLCFTCFFVAGPISEWIIFRRLWHIPISGLVALFRKIVSNALLMGYVGEAYFYAWARERTSLIAAPFGAVKDVAVLSALAGNIATLVMAAIAAPIFSIMRFSLGGATFAISVAVVVLSSLAMLLLRRRLFSLQEDELWFVAAVHGGRIVATIGLAALLWHLILPSVALSWWMLLSALRQLVSRLPLVPNKDVVFAGLVATLIGHHGNMLDAVTLVASLILLANLAVGFALGMAGLARTVASRG